MLRTAVRGITHNFTTMTFLAWIVGGVLVVMWSSVVLLILFLFGGGK